MRKNIIALTSALIITILCLPLTADAKGKYTRETDGTISYFNEDNVTLTSLDKTDEQTLNLADFNANPPTECLAAATACEETTHIIVTTKKVWKPVHLEPITSEELSAEKFAKFYPDLTSTNTIDGSSPKNERLIAQRILYDIGLMPVVPTGKFGFLTELATLKLQCAAGFEEFDASGKAIIGTRTLTKLAELKDRLRDPAAMAARPVSNRNLATCSSTIKNRAKAIGELMGQVASGAISGGAPTSTSSTKITIPTPNFLNLEGEVTIKKK